MRGFLCASICAQLSTCGASTPQLGARVIKGESEMTPSARTSSTLLGAVAAGLLGSWSSPAVAQWTASDVLTIDRVQRQVEAEYGFAADSDSTSGTSVASWSGNAFAASWPSVRAKSYASADQSFRVDADGISGTTENTIEVSRRAMGKFSTAIPARSSSVLLVEFTIDSATSRVDYSMPDSTWSFSGSSPLERLLMDSRGITVEESPVIRASLSCMIETNLAANKMPFTRFNPLAHGFVAGTVRGGAMGARLWRVDEFGVVEAIEFDAVVSKRFSDKKVEYKLGVDLAPGHYVLEVKNGLQAKKSTTATYSAELDIDLRFRYTGPGAVEPTIDAFSRELDVAANGSNYSWSTTDPHDDDWEWGRVGSTTTMAQAGSVAAFEPAGWYGYLHARSKHPASLATSAATGFNELEVEFTLDEASDVGIALLMDFWQRSSSPNVSWDWCELEIKNASTSRQELFMAHGGVGTTSFSEDDAWIALPAGTYTLTLSVGSTCWDQTITAGEDETAVWFALLFE